MVLVRLNLRRRSEIKAGSSRIKQDQIMVLSRLLDRDQIMIHRLWIALLLLTIQAHRSGEV